MKKIRSYIIMAYAAFIISVFMLNACKPVNNMSRTPVTWSGETNVKSNSVEYDAAKKTVLIIADYKLTELFDMLAPFYLFNATEKTNVYIVAKSKTPVLIKRNLYVMPQLTFEEVDSMKIKPDVI